MIDPPRTYNATSDLLDRRLEEGRAASPAIVTTEGRTVTYAELSAGAGRFARVLRDHGVEMENRVLMLVLDSPEFASVFFGAIKIGAVPVPVNTNLPAADYAQLLDDSRAKVAVCSEPLADRLRSVRSGLRHLRHLFVIGEAGPGEVSYQEATAAADPDRDPAPTSPDDMCFWLYTSGTTGRPKGAVHLQHDMRVCADLYGGGVLGLRSDDVTYSVAKLYFAYGLGNALYLPISAGATTVLHAGPPTPAAILEIVARHRPTLYFAVPSSYASLLVAGEEAWRGADLSSVRACVSAGEPLGAALLARWRERTGLDILDGIGTTEIGHIFISNRIGEVVPDSSGRVVPGYEARIVDESGVEVATGEIGTLQVSGDSICAQYWNQHERTKRVIHGAWIDTGDLYRRDQSGHYRYQGRADDMMKVSGLWVSPVEVESCVNSHPSVVECAVVGAEGPDRLVTPECHVVLRPGVRPGPQLAAELREHARAGLAHYKCPRRFIFVDDLPRTATGKIQRFKLRESP